ncbi:hypothetical protein GGR51DRAFT_502981 [Nemania sp. FL0031]|nr:hypothetical protein GGR51DRAFT_502981 [Nemania sp. FL0031]
MALDVPPGTPDRGPGLVGLCIFLIILVTIATSARVASKFVVKQYWWWDDFFALCALPIQITLLGLILSWRDVGLGLHTADIAAIDPSLLFVGAKRLFVAIFFFDSSISFPKLSAIFFYARIFPSNNKLFRINLWIVGSLVVGWIVSAIFSTIFQCAPIAKAWNPTLDGTCIDEFAWYLATASISLVVDFYILLLPVPMIWALNTDVSRRIYLLGAFFLAYSVIVLSLGRLIITVQLIPTVMEDLTWSFPLYLYWACLEGSISLISICVPNIIGLVKALRGPAHARIGSRGSERHKDSKLVNSSNNSTGAPNHPICDSDHGGFERLVNSEVSGHWGTIVNGEGERESLDSSGTTIPLDRIHVKTQISVMNGAVKQDFAK